MTLPAPNLDSRRFQDLVDEAKARIPRFTPEWTNFNDTDPGMTLVKLHAWMTETILYELNRVPDLSYVKFLDLLGIVPEPAHPALTQLSFTLDKLDKPGDALVINVPRLTKAAVDDPDLPAEVVFETDRTLLAVNAGIGALIVPKSGDATQTRQLVSYYDEDGSAWPHAFETLNAAGTSAIYLGLLLRPIRSGEAGDYAEDKFPAGPLDLYADAVRVFDKGPKVLETDLEGPLVEGPVGTQCTPPGEAGVPVTHVEWHVFTGEGNGAALFEDDTADVGWTRLGLSEDGTRGLSGSGHLVFEMPATAKALDPLDLSADFWRHSFGAERPPRDQQTLADQIRDGSLDNLAGLADFWEAMGATEAQLDDLAACGEDATEIADLIDPGQGSTYALDPEALTLADWVSIDEGYGIPLPRTESAYRKLHWIRARMTVLPTDAAPPTPLKGLYLNTVPATQAATRLDDRLGRSNGRPAQVFELPKVPVLIAPGTGVPDLELQIAEQGQDPEWVRVNDFFRSGPDDPHYMLDPETGTIVLGDGRRGRIPVAGSQVTAARYRVGGGAIGNVGAGLITKIKGRLRGVKGVTNLRPSHDGSNAEPLEDVKLRAPHDLRMRDRAVSAEDFADLALRTPGVALHKAFALPRRAVAADEKLFEKDGAVTLLVLPLSDHLTPQPDEDQKRAICRWLEPRRLITTELHVIGPRYAKVALLKARLTVRQDFDLGAVSGAVIEALTGFLHPITGGEDGTGWPFGQDIYYGDLYARLLSVAGVQRASRLAVVLDASVAVDSSADTDEQAADAAADVTVIPEGHLPSLSRDAISLDLAYG